MNMNAADFMGDARDRYHAKGREYGHTYKDFGPLMTVLFPDGLEINTEEDWNKLGALSMVCHKLLRYANLFHEDERSIQELDDMGVYTFILEELVNDSMGHGDNGTD